MRKERYYIYVSHQGEKNLDPYQTEQDKVSGNFHTKETVTPDGKRVIFYKERHALAYGKSMKEYLGVIEMDLGNAEDQKIFDMTADEIRAMNLPQVAPDARINKVVMRGNQAILWDDYFGRR